MLAGCRNPFSANGDAASSGGTGPVVFGVCGPMTGDNAEYGSIWKKAFSLALSEVNAAGGIDGRKVTVDIQDSQADPKQAVTIAEKFAADDSVIAELGDFASPASMAASPIYERAKLTQFGITNSHPDFTKGGEYMWSNSPTQTDSAKAQQDLAHRQGRRQAVLYLDTDWGKVVYDIYRSGAKANRDTIAYSSGFLASSTDFRPILIKARDARPEVLSIIGYYKDAALLTQQARDVGLTDVPIVLSDSAYSPQYLKLGGTATEGVKLVTKFYPQDARKDVRAFVAKWRKRYHEEPDGFGAGAYDAINILIWAAKHYGATRAGVHEGLLKGRDIPSVVTGPFRFNAERRVGITSFTEVVVRDGKYVPDGGR